ncbi:erythromycin esterase family protein [Actinoallomurus sp. NPDC052308]|uniref:erythromycin esterase family protein n=1 Tax=Actinoallomurus sp. NPDC052308 TaxID=3155530 RepID=UPI0034344619
MTSTAVSLALEGDDPVRLGLAAYIATGDGDPRAMLAGARAFWRTEEILDAVRWMRSYNRRHPDDPVRFAEAPDRTAQDVTPLDGLAGLERTLAEGVAWWRERTGDKIVYWGGTAHTAVGDPRTISQAAPPQTHRNMGGHLRERMGQDYRSIGLTVGHGSIGVPLPRPSAQFVDSVLSEAVSGRAGYVLDLREPQPEPVHRRLDAATKTRLIGPFYDPADDAAYFMAGGSLRTWFDVVIHTEEVTPARLLQPLPA